VKENPRCPKNLADRQRKAAEHHEHAARHHNEAAKDLRRSGLRKDNSAYAASPHLQFAAHHAAQAGKRRNPHDKDA
jgi:hypothetical protein